MLSGEVQQCPYCGRGLFVDEVICGVCAKADEVGRPLLWWGDNQRRR